MDGYQIALLIIIIVSSLVLLALIAYLITGLIGFKFCFSRVDFTKEKIDEMLARNAKADKNYIHFDEDWFASSPVRSIKINSFDHLHLHAYLKMAEVESHDYLLLSHGWQGYYKETTCMAHDWQKAFNFNCLFIEHRANNGSEGKYNTMGVKEGKDIKTWCEYILSIDSKAKIVIFGQSEGAFSIYSSVYQGLPEQVKCLICDCGYSSIYDELVSTIGNFTHLWPKTVMSAISIYTRLVLGISMKKDNSKKFLSKCDKPILLIHGEVDTFVPFSNLDINFNNIPSNCYKQKEAFPDAKHAVSYYADTPRYIKVTSEFIKNYL